MDHGYEIVPFVAMGTASESEKMAVRLGKIKKAHRIHVWYIC